MNRWEQNVEAITVSLTARHGTSRAGADGASEEDGGGKCSEITFLCPLQGWSRAWDPWLALPGYSQSPWELLVT